MQNMHVRKTYKVITIVIQICDELKKNKADLLDGMAGMDARPYEL